MRKKVVACLLSIICILSLFLESVPVMAASVAAPVAGTLLKDFLITMGMTVATSAAGTATAHVVDDWLTTDRAYYDSPGSSVTYDYSNNVSDSGNWITSSGANNENCWNTYKSTTTINDNRLYSLVKQNTVNTSISNTMLYNPVTNNYMQVNNTYQYNNEYNTYYFESNEYNYYVTNNYNYVSYYIIDNSDNSATTNNTYYYEMYYEMPDGRNSFDVEKDDIWGEYFLYNVVRAEKVAEDDGKTLALYHLDNSTVDSSFWNNVGISAGSGYYSEGMFGNGLLLNSTEYTLDFPDNVDSSNFTLEFFLKTLENCYFTLVYQGNFYYFDSSKYGSGIYHVVIEVSGGNLSFFLNGVEIPAVSSGTTTSLYKYGFYLSADSLRIVMGVGDYMTPNFAGDVILDEVRFSKGSVYSGNYTVPGQAFDTNMVLALPDNPSEGDIAVQSTYSAGGWRVGGVRPTYPTKGFVWIAVGTDDCVTDIQEYDGSQWVSIAGKIYKDSRWVELKGYNLSGYSGADDDINSSDGGSSIDSNSDVDSTVSGNDGFLSGGISSILEGLGKLLDTILGLIGKVIGIISDFITSVLDLFGTLTVFTDGFSQFLSAAFGFLPAEAIAVIVSGMTLIVILAVIKYIRS